jgi:hypothetical protein
VILQAFPSLWRNRDRPIQVASASVSRSAKLQELDGVGNEDPNVAVVDNAPAIGLSAESANQYADMLNSQDALRLVERRP